MLLLKTLISAMIDYERMYTTIRHHHLHFLFCIDATKISARSLRHLALINATIQVKFPTHMLLHASTARVEDALHDVVQEQGHRGMLACVCGEPGACDAETST